MEMVSIVIPCYNPTAYLIEAIASARAQSHPAVELVVVDDGTDVAGSRELLDTIRGEVDRYIQQPNRGLAAARNTGFRAAAGEFVVPLDSDDLLASRYVSEMLAAMEAHPDAAFVYSDYKVFGETSSIERLPDYNLYSLLDRNILTYAALIRKRDWQLVGGYDESMRLGYEDWEFWLRLGSRGRFGHHLRRTLFRYRKHGPSLFDVARAHHDELVAQIQARHPDLYSPESRSRIKAAWAPAVCVLGAAGEHSIEDCQTLARSKCKRALELSRADAFLVPAADTVDSDVAEIAALAVWGGHDRLRLPDGSLALSRRAFAASPDPLRVSPRRAIPSRRYLVSALGHLPPFADLVYRHLLNSEVLSPAAWKRHPVETALRLLPLGLKRRVNRLAGRPVFDLSFYIRFSPRALMLAENLIEPLRYLPKQPCGRRRIALVTPHLGPGGAETVLLDIAGALDRNQWEIFVIAADWHDSRWERHWRQAADHVYNLPALVSSDRVAAAICSLTANWRFDTVLIQNSRTAYTAVPHLKSHQAGVRIVDLIHAVAAKDDIVSDTLPVAAQIDVRVVISETGRRRLLQLGIDERKIRLIRNGIDLEKYTPPLASRPAAGPVRILFAARLDAVKRPLLLVKIALALRARRPAEDFRFFVAGDGPEALRLRWQIRRTKTGHLFEMLGQVPDLRQALDDSDLVVLTSCSEGLPLVVLEALACGRPVVASNVGAISEIVDSENGVLIDCSPGEVSRFAEAIDALIADPDLRLEMGRQGRRRVEAAHDRRQSIRQYRELLG